MTRGQAGQERKNFLISLHLPYSGIARHAKLSAIGSKIGELKETTPRNSKEQDSKRHRKQNTNHESDSWSVKQKKNRSSRVSKLTKADL